MQRPLDTGDNVYDHQFDYANGSAVGQKNIASELSTDEDAMIIQVGRARVWINSDSFATGMAAPSMADTTKQLTGITSTWGYIYIKVTKAAIA